MAQNLQKLKYLLEPIDSPDKLDEYLRFWLGIELPWDTVDPDSTSAPLKFVWSVYKTMLTDKGPHTHILAAARNSQKTLTSSVIQFLSLLHFRNDGVHIASTLDQSAAAIKYLDNFMNLPELEPYQNRDSVKIKRFIGLPPNDFTTRGDAQIQVVTATKKGANSPRATCLTFDEVDLTPQEILDEAAYIGDPSRGKGYRPIFIYLSSRKTNDGPIQRLIDLAEKQNSGDERLHKWSAADMMQKCPPEIHKPELGTKFAYLHTETLQVIWGKDKLDALVSPATQGQYKEIAAFEGCITCPAFIPCQGYSAKQRGSSKGLRTRDFQAAIVKRISDPSVIIAQTLNWKPESTALVFKAFSRRKHVKDPIDFYQWVSFGKRFNPNHLSDQELDIIEENGNLEELRSITPTKSDIYNAMIDNGWVIGYGVDWGYSPDPAYVVVAGWHRKAQRCAILHKEHVYNFANHIWADYICKNIYPKYPAEFVAPDMADPASPTYFSRTLRSLNTKPSRIEPGVSFIRGLLWNPITQEANFAILDDSGSDNQNIDIIEAFEHWTHYKTPTGQYDMDRFADDNWTHPIDSIRYFLNPFIEEVKISVSVRQDSPALSVDLAKGLPQAQEYIAKKQELMEQVKDYFQREHGLSDPFKKPGPDDPNKTKKGRPVKFKF